MPTALITGITGQDGSFLAEQLLARGWRVVGLIRRSASPNPWRIAHLRALELVGGDLLDMASLVRALSESKPDHVYNLAAQSHVPTSWEQPLLTGEITAMGAVRLLEAVRLVCPGARFYQAGSSEMFGVAESSPQDEGTPLRPRSPYGAAKAHAHQLAINYRDSYGMFIVAGILFNHESERRGPEFVTRKIAMAVARIHRGDRTPLRLGALEVERDWGFAGDYTRAMHLMLSADTPRDYVIASGTATSVRSFAERAFAVVGLDWRDHVAHDPDLLRPAEIATLCGNADRARRELGWEPTMDLNGLIERMVRAELEARPR